MPTRRGRKRRVKRRRGGTRKKFGGNCMMDCVNNCNKMKKTEKQLHKIVSNPPTSLRSKSVPTTKSGFKAADSWIKKVEKKEKELSKGTSDAKKVVAAAKAHYKTGDVVRGVHELSKAGAGKHRRSKRRRSKKRRGSRRRSRKNRRSKKRRGSKRRRSKRRRSRRR